MSDPGTGKTRVCVEVIVQAQLPTLILCPKSIMQCAWGDDIETYAPGVTYAVATAEARVGAMTSGAQVVIMNIDGVKWLKENPKYLKPFLGGILIIDESTSVKGFNSQRTKAVIDFAPLFSKRICMSGTPNPQGVGDLWSQMMILDGGERLGPSYWRFRSLTYTPEKKGRFTTWVEKEGIAEAVAGLIADVTVRNRREDCLDLPENQVVTRRINLSPQHMQKYKELKKQARVFLDTGDVTAVNAAVLMTKLLQLTSGAVYDEFGEPHLVCTDRYELVMDLVEERRACVVAFNWRHQREFMMEEAKRRGLSAAFIDGSVTSTARRTEVVRAFQKGDLRVVFLHPMSAAHGITLTRGDATIWASPTPKSDDFLQLNARIYRGGQTKETETILIEARDTLEGHVYKLLNDKIDNLAALLAVL